MTKVETSQAPAAIGPYSQAVCMGRVVFTSGQIPAVPETGAVPEGIEAPVLQKRGSHSDRCGQQHGKGYQDDLFPGGYGRLRHLQRRL